jgi:hypothetical protein
LAAKSRIEGGINRVLAEKNFADDTKDAHDYEISLMSTWRSPELAILIVMEPTASL